MPSTTVTHLLTAATTAALILSGVRFQTPSAATHHGEEPPLRIELSVGDETFELVEGLAAEHEVLGQKAMLRTTVRPTRRLETPAFTFEYPRHMAFGYERDASLGVEFWTLDGNDVVLMVQRFDAGSAEVMARSILEASLQALGSDATITRTGLRCGGERRTAFTARHTIAVAAFEQTTVGIDTAEGPVILVLQVSEGEEEHGSARKEADEVRALLDRSFGFPKRRDE